MANSFKAKVEKKKASAGNPALMFISQPEEAQEAYPMTAQPDPIPQAEATPLQAERLRRAPQGGEPKTRRLQLLMQPSLYEAIKRRAEEQGIRVNETIGELLRQALGE